MSLLSPCRVVLRTPHACGAFVTSLVGRLCYGIVGLSLLLTLTVGARDYGFAGFVMALFGLTIVGGRPSKPERGNGRGTARGS